MSRYPIPAKRVRVEEVILRSRFIATVGGASTVEYARGFVGEIRAEFADASHNCFAYLVGAPGSTGQLGMSDDGEPAGTAGRPMLAVLSGSGLGDVVAVVTRYFGGRKLGTGGLVRAYSGVLKAALASTPVEERIVFRTLRASGPYRLITPVTRLLPEFEAEIVSQNFGADVTWLLRVPEEHERALVEALIESGRGDIRFVI